GSNRARSTTQPRGAGTGGLGLAAHAAGAAASTAASAATAPARRMNEGAPGNGEIRIGLAMVPRRVGRGHPRPASRHGGPYTTTWLVAPSRLARTRARAGAPGRAPGTMATPLMRP